MIQDSRGVKVTPFEQYQTQRKVLMPPELLDKDKLFGDIVELPAIGRFAFIQDTGKSLGNTAVTGVIEESPDGLTDWKVLFEFELAYQLNAQFKFINTNFRFLRYIGLLLDKKNANIMIHAAVAF